MPRRSRLAARPRLERLDERCVLSALAPSMIGSAYGLNAVGFSNGSVAGTGKGQTIAIVDAYNDPTLLSDLAAFDRTSGLPPLTPTSSPAANSPTSANPGSITMYNLAGSATDAGWSQETALDVEWAHAAAPGANIVLVEARSSSTTDLLSAVNATRYLPGVSVISMSWGSPEFRGETIYDSVFTTPRGHNGITFVASSGDSGAGAQWPASSPNVVSVGGTTLVVNASGARTSETYWSGTGGGVSGFEAEPGYQAGVQSSGHRSVPDVAMVANPYTGVTIVSGGQTYQIGGTSLSSPLFGGLVAIADQGLATLGKGSLDGPTQTLPGLYKAPSGSFNDIVSGPGSRATAGYDTATGLGSPNARTLINALDGVPTAGSTPTPGGTTTVTNGIPTPMTPPRPPGSAWLTPRWAASAGTTGFGSGRFAARTINQSAILPGRMGWS